MSAEAPDCTLQATALVHEAYLRLVDVPRPQHWNGRGHFFAAAAEAMRRILIENARRKKALKHGGGRQRVPLAQVDVPIDPEDTTDVLALDAALNRLAELDPVKAKLVELRFFGRLTVREAADILKIPLTTAENYWAYARCWLRLEMTSTSSEAESPGVPSDENPTGI
jgi:RNA polymerase sigma factor (TIGR02999 family)